MSVTRRFYRNTKTSTDRIVKVLPQEESQSDRGHLHSCQGHNEGIDRFSFGEEGERRGWRMGEKSETIFQENGVRDTPNRSRRC